MKNEVPNIRTSFSKVLFPSFLFHFLLFFLSVSDCLAVGDVLRLAADKGSKRRADKSTEKQRNVMKTQMKWKFWQKKYEKLRGTACSIKSSTPIICRIFWKYFHDFNLIQLNYWITWKIQRYFSWEFEKIAWHSLNFQSNLWSITKQTESWTEHKNSSISQKSTENYTILFRLNKKTVPINTNQSILNGIFLI